MSVKKLNRVLSFIEKKEFTKAKDLIAFIVVGIDEDVQKIADEVVYFTDKTDLENFMNTVPLGDIGTELQKRVKEETDKKIKDNPNVKDALNEDPEIKKALERQVNDLQKNAKESSEETKKSLEEVSKYVKNNDLLINMYRQMEKDYGPERALDTFRLFVQDFGDITVGKVLGSKEVTALDEKQAEKLQDAVTEKLFYGDLTYEELDEIIKKRQRMLQRTDAGKELLKALLQMKKAIEENLRDLFKLNKKPA